MIILGIVLLLLGLIFAFPLLDIIGIIFILIGAVLWLTHAGGRRYY